MPARATICRRWPRACGACARSRSGCLSAGNPGEGAALAKAQFDARRQYDRPAGRARHPRVAATGRSASKRSRHSTSASKTTRWCIDKWFALQAMSQRGDTLDQVEKLAAHPAFTLQNPNRLRSLIGSFGANHWVFNDASGRGYRFLADMIIAADKLNPQTAAQMVPPLGRWRRLEPKRSRADARRSWSGSLERAACRATFTSRRASRLGLGGLAAADPGRDFVARRHWRRG